MIKALELHIWKFDLVLDSGMRELLNEGEMARATRFLRQLDRDRFISAHAQLRMLLGRYLDLSPKEILFGSGIHGKPCLQSSPGQPDIKFNLSHSGPSAIVAVSGGVETGVDIEETERDVDLIQVARRYFAPEESMFLESLPHSERLEAFYGLWTNKEAIVKALGEGVFSMESASVNELLRRASSHPESCGPPTLLALQPGDGLMAAAAALGPVEKIEISHFIL